MGFISTLSGTSQGDLSIAPIINDVLLSRFCAKLHCENFRSTTTLAPLCGRNSQRRPVLSVVLTTTVVNERNMIKKSYAGFIMCSQGGAVFGGGRM